MRNIFLFISILLATLLADASPACSQLIQELKSMQMAQIQLLDSMSRKDDDFAKVLRQQSVRMENHVPKKSDVLSLANAATAYEQHGEKQKDLVRRFKIASAELLLKVSDCL
jgi:hypothetical protein